MPSVPTMNRRIPLIIALAAGTAAASVMVVAATPATAKPVDPATAAQKADALVASRPQILQAGPEDTFQQRKVYTSHGLNYVAYDRTYRGLPVIGGDFVVVTDAAGQTKHTSVAQTRPIGSLSTVAKLSEDAAASIAKAQMKTVTTVEGTKLVVFAAEGAAAT